MLGILKLALLPAIAAALCCAHPVQAAALRLGSPLHDVRSQYADADLLRSKNGAFMLELRNTDYAGVHWAVVDFKFDASDHLNRVTLETSSTSYEAMLALITKLPEASSGFLSATNDQADADDMQIRVCEEADGKVSVVYEPLSSPA